MPLNAAREAAFSFQEDDMPHDRLLPMPELERKVGFKHAKIYRLIRAGEFPPGKLIQGKRLWLEREIDTWIQHQWASAS